MSIILWRLQINTCIVTWKVLHFINGKFAKAKLSKATARATDDAMNSSLTRITNLSNLSNNDLANKGINDLANNDLANRGINDLSNNDLANRGIKTKHGVQFNQQ